MNEEELNQAVQAAFDANPGVEQFHVIANGNCFERENDARHAVRSLRENERWVRVVTRPLTPSPSPKERGVNATTPEDGGQSAPKPAGDASDDAELGGGAGIATLNPGPSPDEKGDVAPTMAATYGNKVKKGK